MILRAHTDIYLLLNNNGHAQTKGKKRSATCSVQHIGIRSNRVKERECAACVTRRADIDVFGISD